MGSVMAAELVLKDVTKTYTVDGNDILALENISFNVKKNNSFSW
jgi:ABC-type oligopeptide transport system ATPase subunit